MSSSQLAPFFTRRAIRIQAMQSLYAYYLKKEVLPDAAFTWQEELEESFGIAIQQIKKAHIQYLQIICSLADLDSIDAREALIKRKSYLAKSPWIQQLKETTIFGELSEKYPWQEIHIIELWYHQTFKTHPFFLEHQVCQVDTIEKEVPHIQALYKNVLFGKGTLQHHIIPTSIHWLENEPIFQDFFLSFIHKFAKNPTKSFQLHTVDLLNKQKAFYQQLVQTVINNEATYEEKIKQQLSNWDIERVQLLDIVLLKMALAEIIHFPDIPKSVAMNEYLEIAKTYSTPKSHLFINGIVDAITAPTEKP